MSHVPVHFPLLSPLASPSSSSSPFPLRSLYDGRSFRFRPTADDEQYDFPRRQSYQVILVLSTTPTLPAKPRVCLSYPSPSSVTDWKTKYYEAAEMLTETKNELDDFHQSSKELEEELERELQRTEKAQQDLKVKVERAETERDSWKVRYPSPSTPLVLIISPSPSSCHFKPTTTRPQLRFSVNSTPSARKIKEQRSNFANWRWEMMTSRETNVQWRPVSRILKLSMLERSKRRFCLSMSSSIKPTSKRNVRG